MPRKHDVATSLTKLALASRKQFSLCAIHNTLCLYFYIVSTMADAVVIPPQSQAQGIQAYYRSKIQEMEVLVRDKAQNFRRLEAQRNELNTKGAIVFFYPSRIFFLP